MKGLFLLLLIVLSLLSAGRVSAQHSFLVVSAITYSSMVHVGSSFVVWISLYGYCDDYRNRTLIVSVYDYEHITSWGHAWVNWTVGLLAIDVAVIVKAANQTGRYFLAVNIFATPDSMYRSLETTILIQIDVVNTSYFTPSPERGSQL